MDAEGVVRELEQFTLSRTRRLIRRTFERLTAPPDQGGTPVRSGWASSEWVVTLDVPPTGTLLSRQEAESGGVSRINQRIQLQTVLSQFRLGREVYLANNTPHIGLLNEGLSSQASAGFVEAAIAAAEAEAAAL
jgi:hypothetical protein